MRAGHISSGTLFKIEDNLSPALREYAMERGLRGKELYESMRIMMRKLVFHAIQNIPKGNKERLLKKMEIQMYESKVAQAAPRNPSKAAGARAAKVNRWRGTLAAWIVFRHNIYGARAMKPEQAFAAVNKWVMRKVFAINLHKAGLLKARTTLRVPGAGEKLPRLRDVPGDYFERVSEEMMDLMAENWARASGPRSVGITGLAPDAFEKAMPVVEAELIERLFEKFKVTAKRCGFDVT